MPIKENLGTGEEVPVFPISSFYSLRLKHKKYYVELPDGYRLIFEDGEYVGRYDSNLNRVLDK